LEISAFLDLCSSNKRWCQALLKTTGSGTFDVCLFAMMMFPDLILLPDRPDTLCLSTLLQNTLKLMRSEEFAEMDKKLMLWILFIGSATAHRTNPASWYRGYFANTLAALNVSNLKGAKRVLVEFFWVDGLCDVYLVEMWKLCEIGRALFVAGSADTTL
jgi:hypothetical protein